MFKKAKPFFINVITPLHAGSGQELGIVDMPIQRERHTGFPKIEGSGLKGSIREVFEEMKTEDNKVNSDNLKKEFPDIEERWEIKKNEQKEIKKKDGKELIKFDEAISLAFGPEKGDAHAGALGFTDARILLFPVKSMKGVFAYITCPMVLKKFQNELGLCGLQFKYDGKNIVIPSNNTLKEEKDKGKCIVSNESELEINGNVILEEYAFEITGNEIKPLADFISEYSDIPFVEKKLVILSDDDFKDFVNLSTEVITRTKIDPKTGTVQSGALFTEEYLPTETVMYSLALSTPIFKAKDSEKGIFQLTDEDKNKNIKEEDKVMKFFEKGIPDIMQIGGNATIGKGIVQIYKMSESG